MATIPVDELRIIERFGPHANYMRGEQLSTTAEPDRLVKTHCCFCGQQCGIQLKVKDNVVIGFEPWEEFPFNRGMLCPKGVKRYLQANHPDRLLTALRRDPGAPGGFSPMPYERAVAHVADEVDRLQKAYGNASVGVLGGASLTTEKTYLLGKFARVCLRTPYIDYNGRLCMVSAGAANKKAFGIDRTTNPWSDMVGTEVIWVAGSNVAECSPITTNYIWQAREMGAKVIVQDPRITPVARTCDLFLPVKPGRDAAVFAGVLHLMIESGWIDRDFVEAHTVGFEQVAAAVRARLGRHPHLEVGVGDVAGELGGVLLHQRALAAGQVDPVEVVPLGVAVVHADEDAVGPGRADADDLRGGLRERGEVAGLVAGHVHRVQVEVLVTAAVAQVEQRVRLLRPEIVVDAARLVVGDRLAGGRIAGRRDPDVHHAVDRRDPAQVPAVGTDLHAGAFGIAEQRIARDQLHLLRRLGRGRGAGGGHGVVLLAGAGGQGQGEAGDGEQRRGAVHGGFPGDAGTASEGPR